MAHMQQTVALTYDLRGQPAPGSAEGAEFDDTEFDTPQTLAAIEEALGTLGYRCDLVGSLPELMVRLVRGDRWDMVFNMAEGHRGFGREAQVPAVLEEFSIPYTLSDPLTMCVALHKPTAQALLRAAGVPTAPCQVVERVADVERLTLPFPVFAKPVAEGTSKGVSADCRADDAAHLRVLCADLLARFAQPVLVECFLPGPEYTVGVLGSGQAAWTVGVSQLQWPDESSNIRTAANCWSLGQRLIEETEARPIAAVALHAWRTLGGRDAGRIDVRRDEDGTPCVIDVNTVPGCRPGASYLALQWELAGRSYTDLIGCIMASAEERIAAATGL